MSKLRVEFVKSLGIKFIDGDEINTRPKFDRRIIGASMQACDVNSDIALANKYYVTSFAPRKNEGVQPCGDGVPVVAFNVNGDSSRHASIELKWCNLNSHFLTISTWKPDLDALIKMQDAHDKQQEEITDSQEIAKIMNDEFSTEKEPTCIKEFDADAYITEEESALFCNDNGHIYTKEMALIHSKPVIGMLCRVEFKGVLSGLLDIQTVTYLTETEIEICVLDEDGRMQVIDKEWFVSYHPVLSEKEELEAAQIKQLLPIINAAGGDIMQNEVRLIELQKAGCLSEIILPLEGK